jgi:sensor c-di-GMP phosphodiesterase-like protein
LLATVLQVAAPASAVVAIPLAMAVLHLLAVIVLRGENRRQSPADQLQAAA